jgi:hypothetical protein
VFRLQKSRKDGCTVKKLIGLVMLAFALATVTATVGCGGDAKKTEAKKGTEAAKDTGKGGEEKKDAPK